MCQIPGANGTSGLTPVVKVWVESCSLPGLAPGISAFMCVCGGGGCVPVGLGLGHSVPV